MKNKKFFNVLGRKPADTKSEELNSHLKINAQGDFA